MSLSDNRTYDSDIDLASRIVGSYETDTFFIAYIITSREENRNTFILNSTSYRSYMTQYVKYKYRDIKYATQ